MRILANFSSKVNGESFSVTFETMGDVPKDQADSVVDDLFAKARAAVQRQQVKPEVPPEAIKPKIDNGNGHNGGNGKETPAFVPSTKKQQWKLGNILEGFNPEFQRNIFKSFLGREVEAYSELDKGEASRVIEHLLTHSLQLEDMHI